MDAAPVVKAAWAARLALAFERRGDRTVLAHAYHEAPLKVLRPTYATGGGACQLTLLHNAGGMVAGDRLAIEVQVGPSAHACLATASAGKVYRSEGAVAEQAVSVAVGEGAIAEWRPLETILFKQARYRQALRVELAPGARFFGWELTRFGRTAMGERFLGGWWRNRTEVWRGEEPLWIDRQWLPGEDAMLEGPFGLASQPVVGTLCLAGQAVTPAEVAAVRGAWRGQGEVGVSRLAEGLVCRYRGPSSEDARAWFEAVRGLMIPVGPGAEAATTAH
jgi:urease accessory protein